MVACSSPWNSWTGQTWKRPSAALPPPPRVAAQLMEAWPARCTMPISAGSPSGPEASNVLLTAEGVAKITDFGLAKLVDGEASRASAEALIGTPSYMAPEQAAGPAGDLGPPTDVYALVLSCITC